MPIKQSLGSNPYFASLGRVRIFRAIAILFVVVYLLRLFHLQFIQGSELRSESESQAIKKLIVEPEKQFNSP